jgi:hypothetical protein
MYACEFALMDLIAAQHTTWCERVAGLHAVQGMDAHKTAMVFVHRAL